MQTIQDAGVTDAAHARYLATKSFGSLDGLRAVSILAVLWHHSNYETWLHWPIATRGFLGVDLFFVISGFLIVTLLLRERRRSGDVSLRRFYLRRFLRIFPPYYLTLSGLAVLAYATHGSEAMALRRDLPYALFYLSNLVPMASLLAITWSLSAEEQFYLVVPTLEKYLRRQLPVLLPLAYVLVSLPPFGFFSGWNLPGFFRQTTFGPILLGVILAHVLDDPRGFARIWWLLRHPFSPLVAVALVMLACSHPAQDLSGWPRIGIHFSLLLLLASCAIREQHVLRPFLFSWPLRRIGIVSYGIYLYHKIAWHFVFKGTQLLGFPSKFVFFLAMSLVTWGIAELSYRLYESRFLALKSHCSSPAS